MLESFSLALNLMNIMLHVAFLFSVECYDPTTKQWRFVASMSRARRYVAVGVLNGLLYAVGGYDGTSVLDSVEMYDPKFDQWKSVGTMNSCRRHVAVGVLTGKDLNYPSSDAGTAGWLPSILYHSPVIYQTLARVFDHISKHRERKLKNRAQLCFLTKVRGVWKHDQTLVRVFETTSQTNIHTSGENE